MLRVGLDLIVERRVLQTDGALVVMRSVGA